jgi:hypothetical protein
MSFLAPLFLAGALAIGLPIVFHLIRRTTRERTLFSSLMFLTPSPPRLVKRNRIEHLLLLLLRCSVICALALGFARPFFHRPMPSSEGLASRRILVLLDDSASMRRAQLWPDALDRVKAAVRDTTPLDEVALYLFDNQLKPLFTFDQWKNSPPADRRALLLQQLSGRSPGWGPTRLGTALIQAAEILTDSADKHPIEHGLIVLITDLHEGNRIEALEGYDWPRGVEVATEVLKPRSLNNASLQLVPEGEDSGAKAVPNVRVRVANAAGSKQEQFKVGWALPGQSGFAGKPMELYVPAGQSRVVSVPAVSSGEALNSIRLQGDDEEFDNLVFAAPPESVRLNIVYIGNDSETDPKKALYFLKRAFQETRHQTVRVDAYKAGEVIPAAEAEAGSLFVVTAPLPGGVGDAIRERALAGKTVLVAGVTPDLKSTLCRLLAVADLPCEEVHPSSYALLGELDFRHPVFSPFSDPRYSDFTKIHFWKYARLDAAGVPSARVLARFDSGDPAFIEVPVGAGKIFILTSGWQAEFSQLALSSKFVPLMYSILETSGVPQAPPAQYRVGDTVPLGQLTAALGAGTAIALPDGSKVDLADGVTNFTRTDLPGLYTATASANFTRFVVNLDPSESRTSQLSTDELERLGVPVSRRTEPGRPEAIRKARLQNAELENRQKLWRWCIVAALVVLLFESWLAGRSARRNLQPASAFSA